jgi:diguanylate cyclase (GGDEF)-like protein/PAS domain S-box-containing protein
MSAQTKTRPKERVLVIDDEPQVLVALEDALSDDFDIRATDRATTALRWIEDESELAVVLSDQRMPDMTGDELFSRVRQCSDATRMLATGYADLTAVVRAVNDGNIFAYVTKPWQRDDLRMKVTQAAEHFRLSRQLEEERQLLTDLMTSMSDAIFFKDRDHRYVRVNDGLVRLLGASGADAVLGKSLLELMAGNPAAAQVEVMERSVLEHGVEQRDVLHEDRTPQGSRWLSTTRAAIRAPSGRIRGLVGIARDVTQRVMTDEALRTSEERLRLAFHASKAGLFDWNLRTGEVYSAAKLGLFADHGFARDRLPVLEERVHPDDRARLHQAVQAHLARERPDLSVEIRWRDAHGEYRWLELNGQAAWDEQGQPQRLVGAAVDITARKEHAAQLARLEYLANYDDLTALPNRSLLATRIERQIAIASERGQNEKLAVAVVDVGRLRMVNESLGRRVGDELISAIAQRLAAILRPEDALARYDGASFAVLLCNVGEESEVAQWFERQVMPKLGEVFAVASTDLHMSFKSGIALFPNDGSSADALLANAEAALKKAKHTAQTYLFYASSMNSKVAERLTLEGKLRNALSNDQFLLYYQPKVQLRTGRIVGLEALIRWQDPARGLVPPGLFIPVLEETEMILDVGRWVLERAARQYLEWQRLGHDPPRIAVNVSAIQLAQRGFIDGLDEILRAYPGASSGLDLEITESVLMDDLAGNIEKLHAAKRRGLRVAIDDFGTGYSSLGYLSRLPLDALKVDRSFIDRMAEDPQQMSIVTTIISLAHSMELKVIAEGVETATQAQLLLLLRCDEIQGYLIEKPVPADKIERHFSTLFELPKAFVSSSSGRVA